MTYEIGYRKPPRSTQFQAGTSGNPRGRPKGSKNFSTLLEQALSEKITVTDNGRRRKVTRMEAMVMRLVNGGLQGDLKTLLTLVEVMRKTGQLLQTEPQSLLPDNHESILSDFVAKQSSKSRKS